MINWGRVKRPNAEDHFRRHLNHVPCETWYPPGSGTFEVISEPPGAGFAFPVSVNDVLNRLSRLPSHFLQTLERVKFSRMTRKKLTNPCYGLAWETTIYLYPFEESFEVDTGRPPTPREQVEARMYGARLVNRGPGEWVLQWTKEALRDFYLNNILIHELAHILDDRNTTYADRERFAEAFATRYGYQATGGWAARHESKTKKRHHKK